ncbi:MAG: HAD family hydrolase [Dehalococcoidia bacterium]
MTASPIRAVCFDFDQTLAYMQPSHWALYAEAARAAGIEVSEATIAAGGVDNAWAPWMTPLGPVHREASASQEAFRALRAALAADRIRAACPASDAALAEAGRVAALLEEEAARYVLYDDTLPALRRLRDAGVSAYIVSNHIWALPEIAGALLGDLVAGVVTSARVGVRKPHPAIFEAALALSGTAPAETLMVGDSLSADVRGGERAGMRAVLLDRDGTATPPEGVRVVRSLLDVPMEWEATAPVEGATA